MHVSHICMFFSSIEIYDRLFAPCKNVFIVESLLKNFNVFQKIISVLQTYC